MTKLLAAMCIIKLFVIFLFVSPTLAVPVEERQTIAPTATIANGTIIGSTTSGIDSFSGIPFAQPPVGNLRLRPPQPLTSGFDGGTFMATNAAAACPQFAFQVDNLNLETLPQDVASDIIGELINSPIGQTAINQNEDCLTISVQRPTGISTSTKLPVSTWRPYPAGRVTDK